MDAEEAVAIVMGEAAVQEAVTYLLLMVARHTSQLPTNSITR